MPPDEKVPQSLAWLLEPAPHETLARMRASGDLATLLPEVDALYGVPANPLYHPEVDTGIHVELVLQVAAELSQDGAVRFAALVHDLGKALTPRHEWPKHINHEVNGLPPVREVCERFGVPPRWRQLAEMVCELHLRVHRAFEITPSGFLRFYATSGLEANPSLVEPFLLSVEADKRGRTGREGSAYPQGELLRAIFKALGSLPMTPGLEHGGRQWSVEHNARLSAVKDTVALFKATNDCTDVH